jgi:DNA-binding response OmpR family regulator/tetratricopeptide (TPR) repeat protein
MTIRVLLAESSEALAGSLRRLLVSQGMDAVTAANGVEALQRLAAGDVDLLILDLGLAGVSGLELLEKLHNSPRWETLPVIALAGAAKGEDTAGAVRNLGVAHCLEKPFTREAFLHAVRSTIAGLPPHVRANPFLTLLVDIYHNGRCGLLTLAEGSPVLFLTGEPITFQARGHEDFPAFLAAHGKIGQDDLRNFVASGEGRLYFTQVGVLSYEELIEESRLFIFHRLLKALEAEAPAEFVEGAIAAELPFTPLSVPRMLYEAFRTRATGSAAESFLVAYGGYYPARTAIFFRHANLTTLRREDIELLEWVDGRTSLRDIFTGRSSAGETAAFFQYLLALGMIELCRIPTAEAVPDFRQKNLFNRPLEELHPVEEASVGFADLVEELSETVDLAVGDAGMGAPLSRAEISFEQMVQRDFAFTKDKNYYELFDLSPSTFSFNALKEAYFAKSRQYSPERFMELSGTTMVVAQDVLALYANAYNTLSSIVAKERYDEMLNADRVGLDGKQDERLQARIQFQSGNVFLEMEEFDNAEKALQDAYTLEPDNPMHCAWLAWAIYRNPVNRNSRAAMDKARMLLAKSLQCGRNAEAFAFRGWMLLDEGRDGLAEGEFQKALKLNPKEPHARQGLQLIGDKREAEKKGLFRKFFG